MTVRRNLVANLAGQGWSALLNIALVPIYLALLGPEAFGLIGFASVVLVVISLLDGGIGVTLNRSMVRYSAGVADLRESADLLRSFELVIICAAMILAVFVFAFGPSLAGHLLDPDSLDLKMVQQAFVLMTLIALLRVVEAIYRAALLGLGRPVTMNVISVAFASARVLGPIPYIVWLDGDVVDLFRLQLAVSLVSLICFGLATHLAFERRLWGSGRFRLEALRGSLGFAGSAFLATAFLGLINQSDKLMVAHLATLTTLGYYSAAGVVVGGTYQLVLPVFQSFYPRLAHSHALGDEAQFEQLFRRVVLAIGMVAGVPIAIILVNADEVLFAWTGDLAVVTHAGPILVAVCAGALSVGLFHAPLAALMGAGRQGLAVRTTVVLLAALLPAMLVGWRIDFEVGLAHGWSAALTIWYLATVSLAARQVCRSLSPLLLIVLSIAPFAIAWGASLAGSALLGSWGADRMLAVTRLGAIGLFALAVAGLAMWIADRRVSASPRMGT